MTCFAIQQSDEMHCARCNLRWDVNDPDPPICNKVYSSPLGADWFDFQRRLQRNPYEVLV